MDMYLGAFVVWIFIQGTSAIRARYTTALCPGTVGPTFGEHVLFDPAQRNRNIMLSWHVPEVDLDCWVTLVGQERLTTANYRIEFRFKGPYSMKGYGYGSTGKLPVNGNVKGSDCETAYIELYNATDDGVREATPIMGPSCGSVSLRRYESVSRSMVLHVFVAAVPEYLLTTVAPTPAPQTTMDPSITLDPNMTPAKPVVPTPAKPLTTLERCLAVKKCPQVKFQADFTSYLAEGCYEDGTLNDDDQVYCLTGRCIAVNLLCDGQNSNNCGDWSDQIGSACIRPTRPPPVAVPADFTPVYLGAGAGAAALLLLLVLYCCCWRPGYLPWRLARLRNTALGRTAPCGRGCGRSGPCGGCGCYRPTRGLWRRFVSLFHTQTESQFPDVPHDPTRTRHPGIVRRTLANTCCFRNSEYDCHGNNLDGSNGGQWMNFAFDDGAHVRETR